MTDGGMRFRIMGGLDWTSQGVSLHIGRRRERLLLGLLLLDIGRVVPAHRLIDLLWDEGPPPSSARGSLQVHISRLRGRFLEADAGRYGFELVRSSGGYLVEGDSGAVDLHRFRALLRQAERTHDHAERLRLLDLALDDWGGPVLAGTAPDGLVRRLGTGFDELHLSALTQRAEARLALGQRGRALEELARATADHPHHERLAMLRMVALYRADHRGEALEVYNETRARLAEDLGLDPGTDLSRVQGMILRADPALLDDTVLPGVSGGRGGDRPASAPASAPAPPSVSASGSAPASGSVPAPPSVPPSASAPAPAAGSAAVSAAGPAPEPRERAAGKGGAGGSPAEGPVPGDPATAAPVAGGPSGDGRLRATAAGAPAAAPAP
ncbi:AfsR/SARP family transcriptional regulator, partial [Streptomyces sp. NPDC055078]